MLFIVQAGILAAGALGTTAVVRWAGRLLHPGVQSLEAVASLLADVVLVLLGSFVAGGVTALYAHSVRSATPPSTVAAVMTARVCVLVCGWLAMENAFTAKGGRRHIPTGVKGWGLLLLGGALAGLACTPGIWRH